MFKHHDIEQHNFVLPQFILPLQVAEVNSVTSFNGQVYRDDARLGPMPAQIIDRYSSVLGDAYHFSDRAKVSVVMPNSARMQVPVRKNSPVHVLGAHSPHEQEGVLLCIQPRVFHV